MLCASEQRGVGRGRGSHSQLPPVRRHYGEQGSEGGGVPQPRPSHSDSWCSRSQPSASKGERGTKRGAGQQGREKVGLERQRSVVRLMLQISNKP